MEPGYLPVSRGRNILNMVLTKDGLNLFKDSSTICEGTDEIETQIEVGETSNMEEQIAIEEPVNDSALYNDMPNDPNASCAIIETSNLDEQIVIEDLVMETDDSDKDYVPNDPNASCAIIETSNLDEQIVIEDLVMETDDSDKDYVPNDSNTSCSMMKEDSATEEHFEESDVELDDSDQDKDYVPDKDEISSESDFCEPSMSDVSRNPSVIEKQNNRNEQQQQQNDPYLSSEEELDTSLASSTCRRVKNKTLIIQKGRKRVRNPDSWICNVRKKKLAAGEEYVSKKGLTVAAKVIKPPCKCRLKCYERLTEENRKDIFKSYWDKEKSFSVKRQFIVSCIEVLPITRQRKEKHAPEKAKENTLFYYFKIANNKIKVCKVMFLNTLCISNTVVVNCLKNLQPGGAVKIDERGKNTPTNKTSDETIENVIRHISSFPCYDSHYSREKSQYKYLGPELYKEKMYTLYLQFCEEEQIDKKYIAKKWVYFDTFDKKFKLSFKPPEVDTCDVCDSFQARLKDNCLIQSEKTALEQERESHLNESRRRYNLKSEDTKMSKTNSTHKVLTGDLQKCLPTPLLTNSISFYKRKLWTFNYTLHDSSNNSAHCMMWDESKGGRGGDEISSAILKWAHSSIPTSEVTEITLWSDNCYGQNKNISIIMCFFWIMHEYPQVKCVNLKYLLKGHTHMEADTIHALIEKKRKKLDIPILTPWDWQQMVRQCSTKFKVHSMEAQDFKKFNALFSGKGAPFVYRKKTIGKEKVLLSSSVHIQMRKENIGMMYLKSSFDSDFDTVDLNRLKRRSARLADDMFPELLPVKPSVPISVQKYNDLVSLLPYIPTFCHSFFKDLPFNKDARQDSESHESD